MSSRNNLDLIEDMNQSKMRILEYMEDIDYKNFCDNFLVQDAIIRNIEIIGEATKKLSGDFKLKYNFVNWKELSGMRDKMIHDYSSINYDIVFDTIDKDIPILKEQIEKILKLENY